MSVVLLDHGGGVVGYSTSARTILESGDVLTLFRGGLRAVRIGDRRILEQALSEVLLGATPMGSRVRLTRASDDRHLFAHLIPVLPKQQDLAAGRVAIVMVLIDPWSRHSPDALQIQEALGLSQAEARVAYWLAQGRNVREVAAQTYRTEHTIRFHLKQAFAKTGARSQAELVRLVLAAGAG